MYQLLWLALIWVAGTALILGGLMTLGSLLLWLVPTLPAKSKRTTERSSSDRPATADIKPWLGQLKLLVVSLALSLAGGGLLFALPFPH